MCVCVCAFFFFFFPVVPSKFFDPQFSGHVVKDLKHE